MSQISTDIASERKVPQNFILRVLNGDAKANDVHSFEEYESISKIRHDAIHWLICQHREIPFGEREIGEIILDDSFKNHKYYELLRKQTPDMVVVDGKQIKISELTVSRMKVPEAHKITKYRLLCKVLTEIGYDVNLEVIVISTLFSVPDRDLLMNEYKFTSGMVDEMYNIINNVDMVLHRVHETQRGKEWFAMRLGVNMEKVDLKISNDDVLNVYNQQPRKPFNNEFDLKSVLESDEDSTLNKEDEDFIDLLVNEAIPIKNKLTKSQDAKDAVNKIRDFHKMRSKEHEDRNVVNRSFMPLPYFELLDEDSSTRSTWGDRDSFAMIKGACMTCSDPVLNKIHQMTDMIDEIRLTKEEKFEIALDGPGRRKYVIAGSEEHLRRNLMHKNNWLNINDETNDHIFEMSFELSRIITKSDDPLLINSYGLQYARVCQSIYREININAMRKIRGRNFLVKPTGVTGVFIVIHPGPKLRVGEDLSTIWFKVVALKTFVQKSKKCANSWIFQRLKEEGDVFYSSWLSVDAHRLDHYIRCYDKILMAYACYCSNIDQDLKTEMNFSGSNVLGIITMIYMENKRSTSKMLQDVRYLVMTALSMYNYYGDVLDKFKDPIRTPLQGFLLDKILKFPLNNQLTSSILSSKFGDIRTELGTGDPYDKFSGAVINIPRILTDGPDINFKQALCEMYFTMLFNKNQDDPTHASIQILTKILEGEKSMEEVKNTTKLHTGLSKNPKDDVLELIRNPHKNQFSRRAIIIGSKLQASSKSNTANAGLSHLLASQNNFINKYLDEFATYKSSSTFINAKFNSTPKNENNKEFSGEDYTMTPEGKRRTVKIKISERRPVQNPRRRCLEGVKELLDQGYMRSFDLIPKHLNENLIFQIFKKNQIGGVREILILDIHKRVLINILESFSRLICKDDDREMLTHGEKKFSIIRDLLRDLRRGDERRLVMNYNFDKTKWAPSFMPIQFLYMFLPFKKQYPTLFNFIAISLIIHSNKKFILPERLIRLWNNDPHNKLKHMFDENLQKLKTEYLETSDLTKTNESNMGQGILHYTSSLFHLCLISLRDEVFVRLCRKMKIDPGVWRDLVSSDDSYTAHAMKMDNTVFAKLRIILFMKAQEVCERAMNAWTSTAKSSISLLIYEFNSLFGSNLTMYPTTFKFATASVHPVNTDSFFRMVKESYISCRQIVENGGSLELYTIASRLNKIYCESIYHTYVNGINDPSQLGIRREFTPYQIGIYPIVDPALMIMLGPEVHNYEIINNINSMNDVEKKIFNVMHTMVEVNDPELITASSQQEDIFVGVNRIEAHMGPVHRLERIKRSVGMEWSEIQSVVMDDPMLLFNPPKDMLQLKTKVFLKLYQFGSSEAMRTTAASIHYARVSASVSANAFIIPFVSQEKATYRECLQKLLTVEERPVDIRTFYPYIEEYQTLRILSQVNLTYSSRSIFETQNIRSLQLNKMQQRIMSPVIQVINTFWFPHNEDLLSNSMRRDWINLRDMVPAFKDSLEETLTTFDSDRDRSIRKLLLVILRLMGYSSKPMKSVTFGQSSKSYDDSYLILKQQNMFADKTSIETRGLLKPGVESNIGDKMSFAFNLFVLSLRFRDRPLDISKMITDRDISYFFLDNSLSQASYKKILLMLLYHGLIDDITGWSRKSHVIFHKWILRGKKVSNAVYQGNYTVMMQLGPCVLSMKYDSRNNKIYLSTNKTDDLQALNALIDKAVELSQLQTNEFFRCINRGVFYRTENSLLVLPNNQGFEIRLANLTPIRYDPGFVYWDNGFISLKDKEGFTIMNTVEGLLHSTYIPKEDELNIDFNVNGINLRTLVNYKPFNVHFNMENIPRMELVDMLRDSGGLDVSKPRLLETTLKRLEDMKIPFEFDVRDADNEFGEVVKEDDSNEKDVMQSFIEFLIEDFDINTAQALVDENPVADFNDLLLDPKTDLNLLSTMNTQRITYQPRKILERVVGIKYHIITKLVTKNNMVNKNLLKLVIQMKIDRNVLFSLLYVYDTQFINTTTISPKKIFLDVDEYLMMYKDLLENKDDY